jgi:SSS family solute:Na+ symporter
MSTQIVLAIGMVLFFATMIVISLKASKRIHTGEDFIVAGRGLSGIMTTATIMATWYAAETILVTADWVRTDGIHVIVLEPVGIGICLIIAGWFYAGKLWSTGHLTLADVFKQKFGNVTEKLQAMIAISYVSWVAVQLIGLAGVFNVFFDIPIPVAILLIAFVLTLYTLIGGMWSVAMTDIVQLSLLLVGIVILTFRVLAELGGLTTMFDQLDGRLLELVPRESMDDLNGWFGLIVLGVFANIATQDLVQRMFSAKSARTAARSCVAAGFLYILFGSMPVLLGLAGSLLLDDSVTQGIVPALAEQLLSPTMSVVFALTLTAAVTSSVDSGLLAPAAVLAKNILGPILKDRVELVKLTRISVVVIAIGSVLLALTGTKASELIQGGYAISLPPLVVLTAALYQRETRPLPAILTLGLGIGLWLFEIVSNIVGSGASDKVLTPGFPVVMLLGSILVYVVSDQMVKFFEKRSG